MIGSDYMPDNGPWAKRWVPTDDPNVLMSKEAVEIKVFDRAGRLK